MSNFINLDLTPDIEDIAKDVLTQMSSAPAYNNPTGLKDILSAWAKPSQIPVARPKQVTTPTWGRMTPSKSAKPAWNPYR